MKPRALVCEGNPTLRSAVGTLVEAHGWAASQVTTATDAIDMASRIHPDLVVLDVDLVGLSGLESIPRVRASWPGARVVAVSMTNQGVDLCLGVGACAVVAASDLARLDQVLAELEVRQAA